MAKEVSKRLNLYIDCTTGEPERLKFDYDLNARKLTVTAKGGINEGGQVLIDSYKEKIQDSMGKIVNKMGKNLPYLKSENDIMYKGSDWEKMQPLKKAIFKGFNYAVRQKENDINIEKFRKGEYTDTLKAFLEKHLKKINSTTEK